MLFLIILILLTSCYDERLLKEHTLILSIGYDRMEEETLKQTVTFPAETEQGGAEGGVSSAYNTIQVEGETTKDTDIKIDQYAPENFDRSKAKIILLGEALAKEGVFTTLDAIYRDLRGPLHASIAIVNETAEDALTVDKKYSMLISDYYLNLLDSAGNVGLTEARNVQDICPIILTDGEDAAIPYIKVNKDKKEAKVEGIALFMDDKVTGILYGEQGIVYKILTNHASKHTKLNLKVTNDEREIEKNYVDFAIRQIKQKMKVHVKEDAIQASLDYTLEIYIDEYAKDDLENEETGKELQKEIQEALTIEANKVIEEIQEANHDGLGIGQRVKAYHNDVWQKLDWDETYPEIEISPTFDIKIITHGIIN